MVVVVIVRALPDIWRGDHVHTENSEDHIRERRLTQYGMVLVIVENDEEPRQQHSRENAANDPDYKSGTPWQQKCG